MVMVTWNAPGFRPLFGPLSWPPEGRVALGTHPCPLPLIYKGKMRRTVRHRITPDRTWTNGVPKVGQKWTQNGCIYAYIWRCISTL